MKKVLPILLSAAFILTGCCTTIPTSNEVAEENAQIVEEYSETDDCLSEEESVSTDEENSESKEILFYKLDLGYYESIDGPGDPVPTDTKPVSKELAAYIKAETKQLVEFINNEYGLDWKVPNIDAYYYYDSSVVDEYGSVRAVYIPAAQALFINTAAMDLGNGSAIETIKEEIIAHELIHGIIDFNRGTAFFHYSNPEGKGYIGSSLHEVITEMITRNYLNIIEFTDYFAYNFLVYMANTVQILYPNFTADILTDNMSKVVEALGREDFERILFFLDCELEAETSLNQFDALMYVSAITEYVAQTRPTEVVRQFNYFTGNSFSTVDEILNFLFNIANRS